jgi:parallel beta-helix repeat protein
MKITGSCFKFLILFFVTLIFSNCKKVIADLKNPEVLSKTYYVSSNTGSDANDGLSATKSFSSLKKAAGLTNPGDIVLVMTGVYNSISGPVLDITRSGTQEKYITYKAMVGNNPKITASADVWNAVSINASYIVFEGIDMEGNNANLTYAGALAAYNLQLNGGPAKADYNTNGVSIGGPDKDSKFPHHIIIRNCKVHDFPGGGLSSIQADYTTFEGNTVYNNAWYMVYAGSGISILHPYNFDGVTSYKNTVRNNVCYNNKTTIPWISVNPPRLSDGNGIIIDVNTRPYGTTSGIPYAGRTLVENNICYYNGGSGIHAFEAAHVDIINNTAYNNGQVVGYAEIFAGYANDVKIINNIMYARKGGACNENTNNTNVTYNYNIYFNGPTIVSGANDVVADPQFIQLPTNAEGANFLLKSTSPAINAGTQTIFSPKDILGNTRPKGASVDCGAYEVN